MQKPNILLLMTDQQRGDALGIENHPVLQTPYLDRLAAEGLRFTHAYAACPVCIPARRTLMTGRTPAGHGVFMNVHAPLEGPTLPECLGAAGYQTHLAGKLHLWPCRKSYGFQSSDWADSPHNPVEGGDDYQRFLRREGVFLRRPAMAHGAHCNGWNARPWHLAEHLHFTNWCTDRALDFLERRDPTRPFFLKVSYHQPHQPCTPPPVYWQRYISRPLPEPRVGDWARVFDTPPRGLAVDSWRTALPPEVMHQYRAGYYGCINHIDDQIGRLLQALPANTVVAFVADHGEMLGDHQWIRKRNAYEPSARIPFLLRFPRETGLPCGEVREEVVELMDVMPTLLDAAGAPIPATVEGRSLLPRLRDRNHPWREWIHGECAAIPTLNSGMQYLTDGRRKFIWFPGTGREQFFDLEQDPGEMTDLAADKPRAPEIELWRRRLARQLAGRPEGFSDGRLLAPIGGPSPAARPEYLRATANRAGAET